MGGTVASWVKLGVLWAPSLTTPSLLVAPNGSDHAWIRSAWLVLLSPHPLRELGSVSPPLAPRGSKHGSDKAGRMPANCLPIGYRLSNPNYPDIKSKFNHNIAPCDTEWFE